MFRQLRDAIAEGRLAPGAQLPPTRRSQAVFGVSRNTCASVYDKLLGAGYLTSRHGSGTFVALRRPPEPQPAAPLGEPDARLNPLWLAGGVTAAMGFWQEAPERVQTAPVAADFRPALVDPQHFPHDVFRRVSTQQLRALERKPASLRSPQGNPGNLALRNAITHHIALTRALACRPGDVVATSGAQQGFDLLARVLVRAGETVVAVEDPGYPPLRVPFMAAGATVVPVPVDEEGLVVEALPREARIICVTPSHQFPLGVAMSPARRHALLRHARERGAVIVEDDYDGEFRFDGGPLQALKAADSADLVFYVGTFSKCALPSLRLGFIVAPPWAMQALVAAKNAQDWHCSTPLQVTFAAFIADGHLTRHVRRMRELYGRRRELVRHALLGPLAKWLEPLPSFYGMHTAAVARPGVDVEATARRALDDGVQVHTLGRYHLGPATRTGLIFGYAATAPAQLALGVATLRRALSEG
ncbi:MAG: PLP-dependent aminotransferase family protein [Burkholderiales bacterium]|nr:PLP-dependent aminotransferase family protein [Burkholderiales bacterium]